MPDGGEAGQVAIAVYGRRGVARHWLQRLRAPCCAAQYDDGDCPGVDGPMIPTKRKDRAMLTYRAKSGRCAVAHNNTAMSAARQLGMSLTVLSSVLKR